MTTENSKIVEGVGPSNVSNISTELLQCMDATTPDGGHVVSSRMVSRSETIAMPMICTLIQYGPFLCFQ